MRSSYSAMLMGALLFGAAAAKEPAADSRYVNVSGRLENLFDYESTNDPDDLLGHGWMTAKLHVARVLSGPRLPPVIIVQYFGPTFIKDGKMPLKLRPRNGEIYQIGRASWRISWCGYVLVSTVAETIKKKKLNKKN